MRIAVLIKQVPRGDELEIVDGRLNREGVELEVNPYCRRANAKAVELAGADGEVVVFTMGPPASDEALREMIACGATRGIHLCDPAFAGSDTLATARALSVAIYAEGPFDLVLCGLNSIDADTGQVGPEIAELLGLPFVSGARELELDASGRDVTIRSETDTGYQTVRAPIPAVVSTAERLCEPSKADVERRQAVADSSITIRTADSLGLWPAQVGLAGSPTRVGQARVLTARRARQRASSVKEAVALLRGRGALDDADLGTGRDLDGPLVPEPAPGAIDVWCILDPWASHEGCSLLGEAAAIAATVGGQVTSVVAAPPSVDLGSLGADAVLVVPGGGSADDWAEGVATAVGAARPRIVLVDGTHAGRVVASKVAARNGWGLTGDGIEIDVTPDGALTVWKPALGGRLVVPITSSSDVQVATIRPGVLPPRCPRRPRAIEVARRDGPARRAQRVELIAHELVDGGRAELAGARVVIGVGQGLDPRDYRHLEALRDRLGATLGATRKVTDRGWMPRSRQIGITGSSISPHLYVSIGASGRFNHAAGFQAAKHVLAINADPHAEIFETADVGIVGDWQPIVHELTELLSTPPPVPDQERRASSDGTYRTTQSVG